MVIVLLEKRNSLAEHNTVLATGKRRGKTPESVVDETSVNWLQQPHGLEIGVAKVSYNVLYNAPFSDRQSTNGVNGTIDPLEIAKIMRPTV